MLSSFNAIVPMACVTAAGIAAMTAEAFREPGEEMPIGPLGVIGLVGAAVASGLLWNANSTSFDVVVADNFGLFVTWVLIIVGLLSLAISEPTIDREHLPRGEYYALMLFAIAGMMLMATASDLLVIFLALEVLSLAVYVLTGIRRDSASGTEAAFKYFLLGAFSSAFFLYGIAQANVKRMLAYSSIAHGGYLLVALLAANDVGKGAVLFYLLTYAVTNIGAFGVIAVIDSAERPNDLVRDYAGLATDHPALAALMTVFLLSLGGFPPMAGFIAKWYVFSAAVKAGYNWLAIIGVLTSVVSVFFYLRIVVMMYMTTTGTPAEFPVVPRIAGF